MEGKENEVKSKCIQIHNFTHKADSFEYYCIALAIKL